jgi:Protein of unknown function (DUF2726)
MDTNIKYNRETIFQWIYKKDWDNLIQLIYNQPKVVTESGDEILKTAVETFLRQFLTELKTETPKADIKPLHLHALFTLHRTEQFLLQEDDLGVIVVELVRCYQEDIEQAVHYARYFPKAQLCADTIKRYEESLPKAVSHSQNKILRVIENIQIENNDYTKPLFNSPQESDFFQALRQVFPRYDVYPNVGLSSLINYENIKKRLSTEEREYFLKSHVDCVVFDQFRGYKPIYFFELDSSFHDTPEQKVKDGYKNKILAVAGQKLYRIRKVSPQVTIQNFMLMIREVLDKS